MSEQEAFNTRYQTMYGSSETTYKAMDTINKAITWFVCITSACGTLVFTLAWFF